MFPSPHSGILFLWKERTINMKISSVVSVPSFGDSFFIQVLYRSYVKYVSRVSVPSFGDSFFI